MPKPYRLKISRTALDEIRGLVLDRWPREAACFALAGTARTGTAIDIIVRRVLPIPPELYEIQEENHLRISTKAINGLAALCQSNGLGALICHSHPTDGVPYSPSDDMGESRIASTLRDFMPESALVASLLITPNGLDGRVWSNTPPEPTKLSEIVVIGGSIERIEPAGHEGPMQAASKYDRQVRAFGEQGQAQLTRSKVGVIGVGGTGSPTAEQLVRLGVEDLVLIDPDQFDESNVTRVYGSFADSLRTWPILGTRPRMKVDVVASHLRRINRSAKIDAVTENVAQDTAATRLLDRDVIFLCTDDHWGRSVVNQIAYQYFIPTINIGTRISARDGRIEAAIGVVDILRPDLPCLWCRNFLSSARIAAESMPETARASLEQEGYVEGIDDHAPSVVSLTTTLSGLAVTSFLQLVTGFAGETGAVSRLNYDALASTVRRGKSPVAAGCHCTSVRGYGDLKSRGTLVSA